MRHGSGLIKREISQTIWSWVVAHGHADGYHTLGCDYDDTLYPLRYALKAFGLFPDAAPVRERLATLPLGSSFQSQDGLRTERITGQQLLLLLPYSPTAAARRILAYRARGELVGDIPSGVQRIQALYGAVITVIRRHGDFPWGQEDAQQYGYPLAALDLVVRALALPPTHEDIADIRRRARARADNDDAEDEDDEAEDEFFTGHKGPIFYDEDIRGLLDVSPIPEARAWSQWFWKEFIPALRDHGWYDPARGHVVPESHTVVAQRLQSTYGEQLREGGPVDVGIVEFFEGQVRVCAWLVEGEEDESPE